jgi:PTS system fructose-specific IIC component
MHNPLYFILALIIGALVAGTIYGIWKPKKAVAFDK